MDLSRAQKHTHTNFQSVLDSVFIPACAFANLDDLFLSYFFLLFFPFFGGFWVEHSELIIDRFIYSYRTTAYDYNGFFSFSLSLFHWLFKIFILLKYNVFLCTPLRCRLFLIRILLFVSVTQFFLIYAAHRFIGSVF